jgi:hypothetical protein
MFVVETKDARRLRKSAELSRRRQRFARCTSLRFVTARRGPDGSLSSDSNFLWADERRRTRRKIKLENKLTAAGLFDEYAKSLTGGD